MQTQHVLGLVLCFGLAFALLAGPAGFASSTFGESPDEAATSGTLGDIIDDASVDEEDGEDAGIRTNVAGDNEPTVVGVIISGGQFIVQLVGAVALFPIILSGLGFPWYWAYPVGGIAQVIAVIGLIQFLGRTELI